MGFRIAGREVGTILAAPFQMKHWTAARNMLRVYTHPVSVMGKYLLQMGTYPDVIEVKVPAGAIGLKVYSSHDIITINEIFCRMDYAADATDTVVVDFGSNIGISGAYFLTRTAEAHVYLFEPLPRNVERLRGNLAAFEGRYSLAEVAVGLEEGEVTFGWEDSGRYGGVGMETGNYITVACVDSNTVLAEVIAKHGRIDILKIDIETLEEQVTARIPLELAKKIGKIYVEYPFKSNPLAATHRMTQHGWIAEFVRLN